MDHTRLQRCTRALSLLLLFGSASILLLSAGLAHAQVSTAGTHTTADHFYADGVRTHTIEAVGSWGGIVNAFVKDGRYAYVGAGPRFEALDLTDGTGKPIASIDLEAVVLDVRLKGQYVYVTTDGMEQLTDTTVPQANIPGAGLAASVFHVIDISNPYAPVLVWSSTTDNDIFTRFFELHDLRIAGDFAFGKTRTSDSIEYWTVIDLRQPDAPVLDQSENAQAIFRNGERPTRFYDMVVTRDYVIGLTNRQTGIPDVTAHQVQIYDISSLESGQYPYEFPIVSSVDLGPAVTPARVVVDGAWAYVLVQDENGYPNDIVGYVIHAINIANPFDPKLHGSWSGFGINPNGDPNDVQDIAVSGGRLYAASGTRAHKPDWWEAAGGLYVFDVASNPGQPVLLGTQKTPSAAGVVADGNTAYVLDMGEGVIAADATDPKNIVMHSVYHSPALINDVKRLGDIAYVSHPYGMTVVGLADPFRPVTLGVHRHDPAVAIGTSALDVIGDTVYLSARYGGLEVIDVSNPLDPTLQQAMRLPDGWHYTDAIIADDIKGRRIVVLSILQGSYTYLHSFEVSRAGIVPLDPEPPLVNDISEFERYATGVYYAGRGTGGVVVVDVTEPENVSLGVISITGNRRAKTIAYQRGTGRLCFIGEPSGSFDSERLYVTDVNPGPFPSGMIGSSPRGIFGDGDMDFHPFGLVATADSAVPLVELIDLSDASNPVVLDHGFVSSKEGRYASLAVEGNSVLVWWSHEYLGTNAGGIDILAIRHGADFNRDGRVNHSDVMAFLDLFLAGKDHADLNGDGRLDFFDIESVLRCSGWSW